MTEMQEKYHELFRRFELEKEKYNVQLKRKCKCSYKQPGVPGYSKSSWSQYACVCGEHAS